MSRGRLDSANATVTVEASASKVSADDSNVFSLNRPASYIFVGSLVCIAVAGVLALALFIKKRTSRLQTSRKPDAPFEGPPSLAPPQPPATLAVTQNPVRLSYIS